MRCHRLPSRRSARQEESDFEATNWLGEILPGWAVLLLGGRPPRRRRAGRLADGGDVDFTGCECVEQRQGLLSHLAGLVSIFYVCEGEGA